MRRSRVLNDGENVAFAVLEPRRLGAACFDDAGWHFPKMAGLSLEEIRSRGLGMEEAWRRGVFCLFGEGSVDLAAIVQRLRALGYDDWVVVEQDRHLKPGQTIDSLTEDARHNREVLRGLGV